MATTWTNSQNISNRLNHSNCGGPERHGGKEVISTQICIHSTVLRDFLVTTCGSGSYEKRVPEFAYSAPNEFIEGILDAYICGDGTIDKYGAVVMSSRSKKLRDGISILLTRFKIKTQQSKWEVLNKKDKNDKNGELKPVFSLRVNVENTDPLIGICKTIKYKKDKLASSKNNIVKDHICNCGKTFSSKKSLGYHTKNSCKNISIFNDTLLDPIVKIEDFTSEKPYVYDLTVETTKNMTSGCGILLRDTFHSILLVVKALFKRL